MHGWQALVANLEPPRLSDPGQPPFDNVPDFPQPAPVGGTRPRQVILNPPFLQPVAVASRPIGPVSIHGLWLATGPPPPPVNRGNVIEQRQGLGGIGAVGPGEAHGQRGTVAIHEQVAFGAFFGPIGGVFAGECPPKTARIVWLSTHALSQSIRPSRPRRSSIAWSNFFHTPRRCQ
jgi:hypothetical protein